MGRGRAKAKQTKVARRLKYSGGGTDLEQLREELGVASGRSDGDDSYSDDYEDLAEQYADYGGDDDDGDGQRGGGTARR